METFENRLDQAEVNSLFDKLFPNGFAGPDVLREIAPQGWQASPLLALFHPSVQQRYEEAVRMHRNLASLPFKRKDDAPPPSPEPTLAEIEAEGSGGPVVAEEEVCRVVGLCVWDIFSDSHDVIDDDGREVSLGSFRGSAGFIADFLNAKVNAGVVAGPEVTAQERAEEVQAMMKKMMPEMNNDLLFQMMKQEQTGPYDYMDFYMGSGSICGRADLTPVYKMIFTRLKALDLDWKYHFPRIGLVDFRPMKDAMDAQKREESGEPEWAGYDPEAQMQKDEENRKKDEEIAEMRESLDEGYRASVQEALKHEPPLTVRVYEQVFGEFPDGWPPEAE